jgi:hypothetical protein
MMQRQKEIARAHGLSEAFCPVHPILSMSREELDTHMAPVDSRSHPFVLFACPQVFGPKIR